MCDAEREAFDAAATERYSRLMGDHLPPEQLRALHHEAAKAAPVRIVKPRRAGDV